MLILINAVSVKKKGGGVFQIATNFIKKTVENSYYGIEWFYVVSEDLHQLFQEYSWSKKDNYFVFPTQPDFMGSYFKVRKDLKALEKKVKPDVVYTIASPSYFSFKAPEVMRFANAWVTNPNEYAIKTLSIRDRVRNKFYFAIQKKLIKRCNYFITQSETVKQGILSVVKINPDNVKVVPNVLPAIYLNSSVKSTSIKNENSEKLIYIASVAAPTPHKNLDIIPQVLKVLRDKHNITNAIFITTLPDNSHLWSHLKNELSSNKLENRIINYGYCTQEQLIGLYSKCEICFMPTLLETFSATLLEAMFFNLAIVASDFSFNRDVTGDCALYYKPMDAEDAADKLSMIIKSKDKQECLKKKISKHLEKYKSFDKYMEETVSFLIRIAEKTS